MHLVAAVVASSMSILDHEVKKVQDFTPEHLRILPPQSGNTPRNSP